MEELPMAKIKTTWETEEIIMILDISEMKIQIKISKWENNWGVGQFFLTEEFQLINVDRIKEIENDQ